MKVDFTLESYSELLKALQKQGFCFQTVEGFMADPLGKVVILRHDVDLSPKNALAMAKLEHGMGVLATYYFRAVPESWDEGVIREIAGLRHEVGYHYECLATASKKMRGLEGKKVSFLAQRRRDAEDGYPMSEVGGQRSEDRGPRSEVEREKTV